MFHTNQILSHPSKDMAQHWQHWQTPVLFTHCPAQLWAKNDLNVVCSSSVAAQILSSQSGLFYYGSDPGETAIPQRYISHLFTLCLGFHPAILWLAPVKPKLHLPKALREQPRTPNLPQLQLHKCLVVKQRFCKQYHYQLLLNTVTT